MSVDADQPSEVAGERITAFRRYDLITNYRAGSSIEEMEPADDGDWIRWEGVAAEIASLRDQLAQQQAWKAKEQSAALAIAVVLIDAGYKGDGNVEGVKWLSAQLAAERASRAQMVEASKFVRDKFAQDEAQGYRSRDRQFVIEILGAALASVPSDEANRKDQTTREATA